MSHSRRLTTLHKCRTGNWSATGSGSGRTLPDGPGDEFDDGEETDDTGPEGLSTEDKIRNLNRENKKHRMRSKEWRSRAEAAEAKLGESGQGTGGADQSEVVLSLVEAGLPRDRIRAAMKLIDWSSVTDVDDAIEELHEDHGFLFESGEQPPNKQQLPSQGASHNRRAQKGGPANQAELMRKYSSLGGGIGNPAKWAGR